MPEKRKRQIREVGQEIAWVRTEIEKARKQPQSQKKLTELKTKLMALWIFYEGLKNL